MKGLLETPKSYIDTWKRVNTVWSYEDYLKMVKKDPRLARLSFEYLYDMIMAYGIEKTTRTAETFTKYKFFDHPDRGKDATYGLYRNLEFFMENLKGATERRGPEKRLFLFVGPVGSSKSSLARTMKRGLEDYSKTDDGIVLSFSWKTKKGEEMICTPCPLNEQPLKLIPPEMRDPMLETLGLKDLYIEGELCPFCQDQWDDIIVEYQGAWGKMLKERIVVRRVIFNENKRMGLGSFKPKDPKDQDPTELLGDINYRKLSELGVDSSPKAFAFDGEFEIANRGMLELIEVLKLDVTFLYEFLEATESHTVKPKKFTQVMIDLVLLGHTNYPELQGLLDNDKMEAFRDRTIRIDIPYVLEWADEIKIYQKIFASGKRLVKHIAPDTLEMAALWGVLTRLEKPKKDITLLQKAKLYDGKDIPGWTDQNVKELRKETAKTEGMHGISPRYIQDKIANALVNVQSLGDEETPDENYPGGCVNPFMVLNELGDGMEFSTLITSEEKRTEYQKLLADVKKEYEERVQDTVRKAISADEEALERLCTGYIENCRAYTQKEKVKNKFTKQEQEPDEKLMRAVEERIQVDENRKDTFRVEMMGFIGAKASQGEVFKWDSNDQLKKAFELKLFEDQKDQIKGIMSGLLASNADKEQLEKIDTVRGRLISEHNYCRICAGDVLTYVASIFARGDTMEKK
jgi:serine protein kinase